MSLPSNSTKTRSTQPAVPSEHPAQYPTLASILQYPITPSALHVLSVLYPTAVRPR
jgi:hypothetical protein